MTKAPTSVRRQRRPWIELLLIFGLPLAVLIAGACTIIVACDRGFTPIAGTTVAPKGS